MRPDAEGDLSVAEPELEGVDPGEFVRRFLGEGAFVPVRGPLKRVKTGALAPRIEFLRDAARRAALDWLVRSGAWRTRAVVAGKRRREGRLWAQGIWEPLHLRFSPASLELLLRASEWAVLPRGGAPGPLWPLPPAVAVRDLVPAALGDIVLFHVVVDGLARQPAWRHERRPARANGEGEHDAEPPAPTPARATPRGARPRLPRRSGDPGAALASRSHAHEDEAREKREQQESAELLERRRALLGISPLTALFRADEAELGSPLESLDGRDDAWKTCTEATARRLAPLVQDERAVLLTYLDDALAKAWLEGEPDRRSRAAAEGARRHLALAAALDGLSLAARRARRPDALRPLLRFFERYVVRFGQREAVAREMREHTSSVVRASDRERILARIARLFGAARPFAAEAERILDTPFVDRSEEEKIFVADYQDRLRSVRPELEAIRRDLAGEVG